MTSETKKRISDINNGIIPEGYKKTKVGIVPVEWDIENLKELCEISSGNTPSRNKNNNFFGENNWLSSGELKSKYIYDSNEKISDEAASELKKYPTGTVVIAIYGLEADGVRGSCSILAVPCTISQACMAFEKFNKLLNEFFYYWYQFNGNTIGLRYAQGTKQQNLSNDIVEKLSVVIPPLPEQQKIAEILSTQDKLIELQERKINQLKTLKKGYLQKMFPKKGCKYPELRFKGFTGAWEQRKLGDYCDMYNGDRSSKYPNAQDMVSDGIPFINAGDLENGRVNLSSCNKISKEKYDDLGGAKLQLGDIVYCLRGTLGKNAYIDNFTEGTVASSLVAIRPKNINGRYMFHVINSDIEYRQRIVNDEGAAQPNLSAKNVSEFLIPIPNIDEQTMIAKFLDNLNNLITLHQRKLDEEKQKKKALMQLLLTGKVRVI